MKILFLSKQRPQNRDLVKRPYGRFYYFPKLMADRGHEIHLLLLNYRQGPTISLQRNGFHWVSESFFPTGGLSYLRLIIDRIQTFSPDWIAGLSDTYYGILAQRLGKRFGIACAIDAYDNYESYIPWCRPLHRVWRSAIAAADVVTAAGPHLADYMAQSRPNKPVAVVPMAPDPNIFTPREREACRRDIGLPLDKKLVGYCGSLHRNRGVDNLFNAWNILHSNISDARMVISGRRQRGVRIPSGARHLGYLSDERVPDLLNAVDVLVIPNRLSSFGEYSCPVKLYEAMQCRIPVVATRTPTTEWILNGRSDFLANPEDPLDLAAKISGALRLGHFDYGPINTWDESARNFEKALLEKMDQNL